jgi:hypothetical protein
MKRVVALDSSIGAAPPSVPATVTATGDGGDEYAARYHRLRRRRRDRRPLLHDPTRRRLPRRDGATD